MRGVKTRESGKWKRLIIFLILLIIFGVLLNSVRKVYKKKESAEKALVKMNADLKELEERGQFLEDSIEKLGTSAGLDFEIRKKLNVAASGEMVAIIVEEEQSVTTSNQKISPWQKFKNFATTGLKLKYYS